MRRKGQYVGSFSIFLLGSLLLILLGQSTVAKPLTSASETVLTPLKQLVLLPFSFIAGKTSAATSSEKEIESLKKQIITLKKENSQLKDIQKQFKNTPVTSSQLIPAHIVGRRVFVPGVSIPSDIQVDKGSTQGVIVGMAVIREDKVIGRVVKVSEKVSQIRLVTSSESVIAAKTLEHDALGIIKGQNKDMLVLQNVVLSDKLAIGDTVITAGDIDTNGLGFPPGLILGKITSIAKTPSALFQAAEIQSSVDITHISTVFLVIP